MIVLPDKIYYNRNYCVVKRMDQVIYMKDVNFAYGEKLLFQNLNFSLKRGSWTTLIGHNGCGKSTLVRLITGLIMSDQYIVVDGMQVAKESLNQIRLSIGVVLENPDDQFIGETVRENIAFGMENLRYPEKEMVEMIDRVSKMLGITKQLDANPTQLSGGEKQLVALASVLVLQPKILILDEAFTMVDGYEKEKIFKLLTKLHKKLGLTILNITHDMEESIYGDDIAVMDQGQIILHDTKENVYLENKKLKQAHLELPFMPLLSEKLGYYHLVDHMVYDMNEMVDLLWK